MSGKAVFFVALIAWLASGSLASAQIGARTTFFIVPLSVGTGVDFLARDIADRLTAHTGKPIAVEDQPGASGLIGTEYVTHAAPDGYTLLLTPGTILSDAAINDRPDPTAELEPIILLTTGLNCLIVGPRTKAKSVKDIVDMAKAAPGKLLYAAAGNGSVHTLAMEQFKYITKADIEHVPYKSSNDAVNDVVAGRVDMMMLPVAAAASFVQNGQVRMLATLSDRRSRLFPNVPTMPEAGFPDMIYKSYYFLMAPRGTPPDIIARYNKDINDVLHDPSFQPKLDALGLDVEGGTPEELGKVLHAEAARLKALVASTNMKVD
jgi:tripartite-type tricarboxylate transporter receptor subunit TctC